MTHLKENIHYVNNTKTDIRLVFPIFQEAYLTGVLDEDFADLFTITVLKAFNSDGSDRMIINAA